MIRMELNPGSQTPIPLVSARLLVFKEAAELSRGR